MKKLLILIIFAWPTVASAQDSGVQRTVKSLSPHATPQSPNVASMAKYGNYAVTMQTGLPSISIPLYDIKVGAISVPIALSYHAAGFRITETASWVGLGWSLNAGGNVSRAVTGLPDELYGSGYFTAGLNLSLANMPSTLPDAVDRQSTCQDLLANKKDQGADLFSIGLPSVSNKFVILRSLNANGSIKFTPTSMPADKAKIEPDINTNLSKIATFTITDENGVKYLCDKTEIAASGLFPIGAGSSYTSTWHLSKIQGHTDSEEVRFSYFPSVSYTDFGDYSESLEVTDQNSSIFVDLIKSTPTTNSLNYLAVQEVVFPGGKVTFEQESSNRLDLVALKALKRVCVWGLNVQTSAYEKVKIYEFVTSYFGANTSTPEEKRLRLDKLLVKDKNEVVIESYAFDYNPDGLPSRKSKDRDMFGLYNGPKNNISLIPIMSILAEANAGQVVSKTIGTANREVSERYSQACILQKITYPTGGYTAFEYENNRFFTSSISNSLAGGLRIAAMKSSPDNTQTKAVTKRYRYGINEDGTGILNNLLFYSPIAQLESNQFLNSSLLRSVQQVTAAGGLGSVGGGNVDSRRRIYVPNYTFSLNGFEGAPVRYTHVTEYEDLATNTDLSLRPMGRTTYRFRQGRADIPKTIKSLVVSNRTVMESFHWDRGQLEEKIAYNSNNQIVQKVVNEYANLANTTINNCGIVVSYGRDYTNSTPIPNQALFQAVDEYQIDYYGYRVGNTKLNKTTEWMDGVEKVSYTDYDSLYYVPTESRFLASNGEVKVQKTKYPFHFQAQVGTGLQTGYARGIQLLIQNNRIATPVEQVSSVIKRNGQRYATAGTISLFQEPTNHINFVFPKAIYVYAGMNTLNPVANYTPLSFTNNLTLDSKYEKRIEFEDYDNYNNLLSYLIDGLRSSYDWNRVVFDNLAFSYLKSETANLGAIPSLTKNYGYKIPLIGIINVQQANGLFTNYEYDDIGRLTKIRDNKGNLVKSYQYNYRNQ